MPRIRSFLASFKAAGRGVLDTIDRERNMRFHLVAMVSVLYLAGYYPFTQTQQAVLYLTIAAVISLELVNTAIETTVDLCCPRQHPLAKRAKDAAAGGVLVAAIAAVFVGIRLFWQPEILLSVWTDFVTHPIKLVLLAAFAAAGIWFIFFWKENNKK